MTPEQLEEAQRSIKRVQKFDISDLARESELGREFNFTAVVPDASRVIELFKQFPIEFLDRFPDQQVTRVKSAAGSFYQVLTQVLEFSAKQENPSNAHAAVINAVREQYQSVFNQIESLISFGAALQRDLAGLEQSLRAAIQRTNDESDELIKGLTDSQNEAERMLADVRKMAEERGVTQQAIYFRQESDTHSCMAKKWRSWTICTAIGLAVYSVASGVLHKVPWIRPETTFDTVQLGISKVLIFGVIGYMLLLCARNFLGHTHNAIVNKHRQNALLTFQALADAAGNEQDRNIVLTHAAACIYAPQDTSYTKPGSTGQQDSSLNIIHGITKMAGGGATSH